MLTNLCTKSETLHSVAASFKRSVIRVQLAPKINIGGQKDAFFTLVINYHYHLIAEEH